MLFRSAMVLESIGVTPDQLKNGKLFKSNGCDQCVHTGFKGRIGIFEIMMLDDTIKTMILKSFDSNMIKQETVKRGMLTLQQDGIGKVLDGVTTIEEVLRVTQK